MTSHAPMMPLRQWLEHRFLAPVVLVAASPEAEASAAKNGMNMLQLLRPLFTSNRTLRARLADRSDTTTIEKMHVRLHYPETVREVDSQTRQAHFMAHFSEVASDEVRKGALLDGVIDILTQEPVIPSDEEPNLRLPSVSQQLKAPLAGLSEEALESTFFRLHDTFARDYVSMVRCSYFDCLDHPVGSLLVGSTKVDPSAAGSVNGSILTQFRELTRRCDSARDSNVTMDDEQMAYYVLVHDMSNGPEIKEAQKIFQMVKNAVGDVNCCMVVINSGGAKTDNGQAPQPMRWVTGNAPCDIYATDGSGAKFPRVSFLFTPTEKSGDLPLSSNGQLNTGCYLAGRDVDELTHMAENFIANNLVPHLEKKHRLLTQSINERRKTGLSRVAAWFSSDKSDKKEREAFVVGRDNAPTKYLAGSVEMCMRRLADISMSLRDFDTAISWYKALLDDLTSSLSSRPFNGCLIAAAQEGIAIATYFQGRLPLPSATRHHDCRFEVARDEYQRYLISSYSFRSSLIMYLLCRNKPITPANDRALAVLTHRHVIGSIGQNRVYSAIINDIAAHCWLFQTFQEPVHKRGIRKFARLMCLAGSDYRRSQLSEHALRCFCRAHKVYRQKVSAKKWTSIYDNLIAELGALYFNQGDLPRSVGLYSSAVSSGSPIFSTSNNAPKNLDNYVSQLLAFMAGQNLTVLPHLVLPNIIFQKYTVHELRYGPDGETSREEQSLGAGVADREWNAMEDVLRSHYTKSTVFVVPKAKSTQQMIADKRSKNSSNSSNKKKADNSDIAAHEAGVGETIFIPIAFHNPVASDLVLTNVSLLFIENDASNNAAAAPPVMHEGPCVPEVIVPSERRMDAAGLNKDPSTKLQLPFTANKIGRFSVVGACWTVKGVRGQFLLSTRAKEEGKVETFFNYACDHPTAAPEADNYIDIKVFNPEANLSMKIVPPLPEYARDGAVHRCELEITNKSAISPASELALYFSKATSHWVFLDDFSIAQNEDKDAPLVLPKGVVVPPNGTLRFKMTVRMACGDAHNKAVAAGGAGAGGAAGAALTNKSLAGRSAMMYLSGSAGNAALGPAAGTVSHLAIMLSYYPHDSADSQMVSTTKAVKLHTLLRRVNLTPAIVVNAAVIASTERACDVPNNTVQQYPTASVGGLPPFAPTAGTFSSNMSPSLLSPLSGGGALPHNSPSVVGGSAQPQPTVLPFANLSLVVVNRASRVDGPVKICRVTCLHDPSWDIAPSNANGSLAGHATEVSSDPLHYLTCSDQGIVLNAAIRRRSANSSRHSSAFDGHSTQSHYLRRYLFLAQNRRLCETVLLSEENLMEGNEKAQTEMRRVTNASPIAGSLAAGGMGRRVASNLATIASPNPSHADPLASGDNTLTASSIHHQRVTSNMTNPSVSHHNHHSGVEMQPVPLPLWFGLTHTATAASRTFGDVPPAQAADFAFYLDKGGAEKSAAEQEMDEDLMLAAEAVADFVPVFSGLIGEDDDSTTDSFTDANDVLSASGPASPTFPSNTISSSQMNLRHARGGGGLSDRQKRKFNRVAAFNKAVYGQVPSQFPPICFIVTWSSDVNSTSMYGQTFHFVDVQGQLAAFASMPRDVEMQQQRISDRLAPTLGLISPLFSSSRSGSMSVSVPSKTKLNSPAAMNSISSAGNASATDGGAAEDLPHPSRAQLISAFQRAVTPSAVAVMPQQVLNGAVDAINKYAAASATSTPQSPTAAEVVSPYPSTSADSGAVKERLPNTALVCDSFFANSRRQLAALFNGQPITAPQAAKLLLPVAPRALVSVRPVYKPIAYMKARALVEAAAPGSPSSPPASAQQFIRNNKGSGGGKPTVGPTAVCCATIPVDVVFTNHSALPVKITVAMLSTAWSRQQNERLPSPHICFEGLTRYRVVVMPDEAFTCSFTGTVSAAGVYNLNNTRFESAQVLRFVEGMRTGAYPDTFVHEAVEESVVSRLDVKFAGADVVWPLLVKHPRIGGGGGGKSAKKSASPLAADAAAPTITISSAADGSSPSFKSIMATARRNDKLSAAGAAAGFNNNGSPFTEVAAMNVSFVPASLFSHDDSGEDDSSIDGLTPVRPTEHCRRALCTEKDTARRPPTLKRNSNPTFVVAHVAMSPPPTAAAAKGTAVVAGSTANSVHRRIPTGTVVNGAATTSVMAAAATGQPLIGGLVVGGTANNASSTSASISHHNGAAGAHHHHNLQDYDLDDAEAPSIGRELDNSVEICYGDDGDSSDDGVFTTAQNPHSPQRQQQQQQQRDGGAVAEDRILPRRRPTAIAGASIVDNSHSNTESLKSPLADEDLATAKSVHLSGSYQQPTAVTQHSSNFNAGDNYDDFGGGAAAAPIAAAAPSPTTSAPIIDSNSKPPKRTYGADTSDDEDGAHLPESPLGHLPFNSRAASASSPPPQLASQMASTASPPNTLNNTRSNRFEVSDSDNDDDGDNNKADRQQQQQQPSASLTTRPPPSLLGGADVVPMPPANNNNIHTVHSSDEVAGVPTHHDGLKSTPPPPPPNNEEDCDHLHHNGSSSAMDSATTRHRGLSIADLVNRRSFNKEDDDSTDDEATADEDVEGSSANATASGGGGGATDTATATAATEATAVNAPHPSTFESAKPQRNAFAANSDDSSDDDTGAVESPLHPRVGAVPPPPLVGGSNSSGSGSKPTSPPPAPAQKNAFLAGSSSDEEQ